MAISYRNIAGEESATVTFRVATVEIARGSTNEQQEILTIGDPQTSNALARVLASAPTSTEYGLGVRIISGPSSAVDLPVSAFVLASSAAPSAATHGQRTGLLADLWGRAYTRGGHQPPYTATFRGTHVPAERTKATVTQASAGAGKRNVVTGFTASLVATSTAPTAVGPITVSLIDGASGGSTYLWQDQFSLPAVAGAKVTVTKANIWLPGGQASAITLEFGSSGGANTYQSVCFDGVIAEE